MGQYIQQGERTLIETVISVEKPRHSLKIDSDPDNLDGLNYLAGKRIGEVNLMAEMGTMLAHVDGGVPEYPDRNSRVERVLPRRPALLLRKIMRYQRLYVGRQSVRSAGRGAYKKNMFALLGKPGYEDEGKLLRARL